jgi:hypothetical protein
MAHHTQGAGASARSGMVVVGGGERSVASTGNVWGSGGQVGDACDGVRPQITSWPW